MNRLDAAKDFQKAMQGRCFVSQVSRKYWMWNNDDERRWTPWERRQAELRTSGLPEEWER